MNSLRTQIERNHIRVSLSTKVLAIRPDGVEAEDGAGKRFFPADTVIYAVGQRPLSDEALALSPCAPEFYLAGDCVSARNIMAATSEAYNAARDIGRM
jgi:hypothetical protein